MKKERKENQMQRNNKQNLNNVGMFQILINSRKDKDTNKQTIKKRVKKKKGFQLYLLRVERS